MSRFHVFVAPRLDDDAPGEHSWTTQTYDDARVSVADYSISVDENGSASWPSMLSDFTTGNTTGTGTDDTEPSRSRLSVQVPSIGSSSRISLQPTPSAFYETQGTHGLTRSLSELEYDSIALFPTFNFSVRALTPLSSLIEAASEREPDSLKTSVLGVVLEIGDLSMIRVNRDAVRGEEIACLELVIGDDTNTALKVVAWRGTAAEWGEEMNLRVGDVVLVENVSAQIKSRKIAVSASPFLSTRLTICYRAHPQGPQDQRLRPDLRLAESDAAVRKVSAILEWYNARIAGGQL